MIISTALIVGLHVQPWFDISGMLDGSLAAEMVEQTFGIDQISARNTSVR